MSDDSLSVANAFDGVDFGEVFADTPLADEFGDDDDSTVGETIGGFVGRHLGAWAGSVVGTAVLDPLLTAPDSGSDETDAGDESDADEGETSDGESTNGGSSDGDDGGSES